jgi:hypothetical protein
MKSSIIYTFYIKYYGSITEENDMDRACTLHGDRRNKYKILV